MSPIKLFFSAVTTTALAAVCVSPLALSSAQAKDCGGKGTKSSSTEPSDPTDSKTLAEKVMERQNLGR
jgi:hypothetical protein